MAEGLNNPSGYPTIRTDFTGVRAIDNVYQNISTKSLFVSVSLTEASTGNFIVRVEVDTANPPTIIVCEHMQTSALVTNLFTLFIVVLPGEFFRVHKISGTPAVSRWTEWI